MNGGIIVFLFWVYIATATILAIGLASLALVDLKQGPSRLGHTVWLCTTCHALYTHQMAGQHCPQGHRVIEATAWQPPPPLRGNDDFFVARAATAAKPTDCSIDAANRTMPEP